MPAVEGDGLVVGMLNLPTQVDRGIALHFHSSLHSTRAGSLPAPARTADWSAIRTGISLGGKSRQGCRASALHRFADEVTLLCAIPASGAGNKRREVFSALRKYARFLSPKELLPSPQHNLSRRE